MCKSTGCGHKNKLPMSVTHPQLAKELVGVDPSTLYAWTGKRLNWVCQKHGHVYLALGSDRKSGCGCGFCDGKKILVGFNDLATTRPDLAKELVGDPKTVTAGSNKATKWLCNFGHVYISTPVRRCRGNGCNICSGQVVAVGVNDMATTHPQLAKELNGDPTKTTAGTGKILNWICPKGHRYKAAGHSRVSGTNCAFCSNKRILPGFNDMATTHPELAKELVGDPTKVIAGTGKILTWVCSNGHHYKSDGNNRISQGSGCSKCQETGFNRSKHSVFYLIHRPGQFKLGIMNANNRRIKGHARRGWQLLDKVDGPGELIAAFEQSAKKSLKNLGIPTGPEAFCEPFDGYTEAWNAVDLEVSSIRDLCEKLGVSLAV